MTLVARINETFLQIAADMKSKAFRVENIPASAVGQATFVVPNGYTPGAIMVFLNGALLQPSDYTATTSPNVVLALGVQRVDEVLSVVVLSAIRAQDDALLAYTVAQLPPAASNKYKQRYCTNMAGGEGPVFSNGTNWLRVSDNTVVTT